MLGEICYFHIAQVKRFNENKLTEGKKLQKIKITTEMVMLCLIGEFENLMMWKLDIVKMKHFSS